MTTNDSEITGVKKNRRKRSLTPFLAYEMLYDFVVQKLDPQRQSAVEEILQTDHEAKRIESQITAGIEYASSLQRVTIDDAVLVELHESENILSLGRKYSSWHTWPDAIRWSFIAIVVSTMVAGTVSVVPWDHWVTKSAKTKTTQEAEPTQVAANDSRAPLVEDTEPESAEDVADVAVDEGSGDDLIDHSEEAAVIAKNQQGQPGIPAALKPSAGATASAVSPPAKGAASSVAGAGTAANQAATSAKVAREEVPQKPDLKGDERGDEKSGGKPKGFVYRAFMNLPNLEETGPRITSMIRGLGGAKAGEVEIGWKRGTGRYYHFSMPEMNEKRLMDQLQVYGPVRISKDPHPRVMPKGQVRFILWIESTAP